MRGGDGVLIGLNRMIGMPVIWQDRQLGCVERAVPDMDARRLDGLVVRKGIGWARWIRGDDVLLVGKSCVLLKRQPERRAPKATSEMRRVFLTTGECAGEVTDAILHSSSLLLAALEVSQGPFYRLMGRCGYAMRFHLSGSGEGGQVVIQQLLSWTQLVKQLGEEDEG